MKTPYPLTIKNIFLSYPSLILNSRIYVKYLEFVGILYSRTFSNKKAPRFILQECVPFGESEIEIWRVVEENTFFLTPSAHRLSRFLKGIHFAANRQWQRYGVDRLIGETRPDIIFDIGANIGEFSLAADSHDCLQIHSFEPDPVAYHCLAANTAKSRVIINNIALGPRDETRNFYSSPMDADSSFVKPPLLSRKIEIQTKTIETYIKENSLKGDFLLKMDAEGAEPEVLKGLGGCARDFKWMAIDVGPENQGKDTIQEVTVILESHGFKIELYTPWIIHAKR